MTTSPLPGILQRYPVLDSWIRIHQDGLITLFTGKVEIGQGIRTAIAQIGAEELDVSLARIRVVTADTEQSPNEGYTAGSGSVEESGGAIRQVAAEARLLLLSMAALRWAVPVDTLTVTDGVIYSPTGDKSITYWELMGGRRFEVSIDGLATPKRPAQYHVVGQPAGRLDLPAKVTGAPCFVADLELPGMVYGRIVRPPHPSMSLVTIDSTAVRSLPGVLQVVHDGNFLGVVAEREEQAVWAADVMRRSAQWRIEKSLPDQEQIYEHLHHAPAQSLLVLEGTPVDDPIPRVETPANAAQTATANYFRPYHMHASLGPSAAIAQMVGTQLTLWTHSQGVYPLRGALAQVLDMADEEIHVIHVEGPGCYGHNGADDVTLDAALLARTTPGRPVLLQWMREDEHAWEPYAPAAVVKMQASLDTQGRVVAWSHDVRSYTHSGRPRPMERFSNLLAAWQLAAPLERPQARPGGGYHGGIHRNADPIYNFSNRRIVKRLVPDSPLRTSSMRGLGAYANVFAIESFMDELALLAGVDPLTFRLQHLDDPRARAVIETAANTAGCRAGQPWGDRQQHRGRGLGFARYKNQKCYAAVVVDVAIDRATGQIHLERAVIAADAGLIINPDGLRNQLEGGFLQAASLTLKEQVIFTQQGITSLDWDRYPILTFPEAPPVEVVLLERPDERPLGSGEATHGPTPAAIANAVFAATGVRLRQIPFTPGRVQAALLDKSDGVA